MLIKNMSIALVVLGAFQLCQSSALGKSESSIFNEGNFYHATPVVQEAETRINSMVESSQSEDAPFHNASFGDEESEEDFEKL